MSWIIGNWEYVLICLLAVDKIVALSPSQWDDLIWTSVKKAIYKVVGK
tara:strand:- start:243 stop:386 length:144 start_codon:yes stop_codon:yes gene_type:complete